VRELEERGHPVLLAKFSLNQTSPLAMFRGGGLTLAEELVKQSNAYQVAQLEASDTDLAKLSCRWQPLRSQHGVVLSLLVRACSEPAGEVYGQVLQDLGAIVGDLEMANPVTVEAMHYRSLSELWAHDRKHQRSVWLRAKRMLQTVVAVLLFRTGFYRAVATLKNYVQATPGHSDYRKFDDMLRMVIDCSEPQAAAIEASLNARHDAGQIAYGLHRSRDALMTCYVHGFSDGQHIHFIDGGNGGYAMAAKQLKAQLKQTG